MLLLRSTLFNLAFFAITPLFSLLIMLTRPLGLRVVWRWARLWSACVRGLLRVCCRIHIRVEGLEHLPTEPCVVMGKHQSALETVMMPLLVPMYAWVLKRELLYIPLFGWALWCIGVIAIRRGSPREAMRQVLEQGRAFLRKGRWVVIFPEGTRTAVGESGQYQPGGVVLAQHARVGILPFAHNAGRCWPKKGYLKYPGTVTIRFLPYLSPDDVAAEKRGAVLKRLQQQIEKETRALGG